MTARPPLAKTVRIICISDTHGMHGRIEVPAGDILIHCGDLTKHGTAAEVIDFNEWLGTLPHPWKIVIAGNHDGAFEYEPDHARKLLTNAVYLEDSETIAAGLRIWGSPWQPAFNDWHFNLPRGEALKAKWNLIPNGIDVLVTHGPPFGVLDRISTEESVGCKDLLAAVRCIRPRLHVFGHIHSEHGVLPPDDGIIFGNATICDEAYQTTKRPLVIRLR